MSDVIYQEGQRFRPGDTVQAKGAVARTVSFGYESPYNSSFHGVIVTEIPVEMWRKMTADEQDEVVEDILSDLVDIWVED